MFAVPAPRGCGLRGRCPQNQPRSPSRTREACTGNQPVCLQSQPREPAESPARLLTVGPGGRRAWRGRSASCLRPPCGRRPVGPAEPSAPCSAPLSTDTACLCWLPAAGRLGQLPPHRPWLVLRGSQSGVPLSGPVGLDLESRDVSTAWGCLLIFLEPTEGSWVALPGTWGCVGTDLGQPGSQTTLRPADRPQAGQPQGGHSLG